MKCLDVKRLKPWEQFIWTCFIDTRLGSYVFKWLHKRQELRREHIAREAFREGFCDRFYKPEL